MYKKSMLPVEAEGEAVHILPAPVRAPARVPAPEVEERAVRSRIFTRRI